MRANRGSPISQALCLTLVGQARAAPWSTFAAGDWQQLEREARAEGVVPLLYHALESAGWPPAAPAWLRPRLQAAYYTAAGAALLAYRQLTRVLNALAAAGDPPIPALVLKGPALAAVAYPDSALRPFSDLDILVPRDRLNQAADRLAALGYADVTLELCSGLNSVVGHHVTLAGGQGFSFPIELHWSLVGSQSMSYAPSLDWFWDQAEEALLLGCPALILSPGAHLLYLAAHLMLQHGGAEARLIWYYDLNLLIRRFGPLIDWDDILDRADQFHWRPALAAALLGARERFQTPVPHPALTGGSHRSLEWVGAAGGGQAQCEPISAADRHSARLVRGKAARPQTRALSAWYTFSSLDRPGRMRLVLGLLFPSPVYMRWRYRPRPGWSWPLWYLYRWLDIIGQGVAALGKLSRRIV